MVKEASLSGANKKIALIPIGQSPRPEVAADFRSLWGSAVDILESGALDGLSAAEINGLKPRPGEAELITRLADGQIVYVSHQRLIPYVEKAIARTVQQGAELAMVLCTGDFSPVKAEVPVLEPNRVLAGGVAGVLPAGTAVTVLIPTESQREEACARWSERGFKVDRVLVAAPFGKDDTLIEMIKNDPVIQASAAIIGDCFGFDLHCRELISRVYPKQIFIPRLLMGHLLLAVL